MGKRVKVSTNIGDDIYDTNFGFSNEYWLDYYTIDVFEVLSDNNGMRFYPRVASTDFVNCEDAVSDLADIMGSSCWMEWLMFYESFPLDNLNQGNCHHYAILRSSFAFGQARETITCTLMLTQAVVFKIAIRRH